MRLLIPTLLLCLISVSACKKPALYKTENDVELHDIQIWNFGSNYYNDSVYLFETDKHPFINSTVQIPNFITSQDEFNYWFASTDSTAPGYYLDAEWNKPFNIDFENYMFYVYKPYGADVITKFKVSYSKNKETLNIYVKELLRKDKWSYHPTASFIIIPNKYKNYQLETKFVKSTFPK